MEKRRPKTSSGYLPTLDGWRAIAILLVIGSHDRLHRVAGVALTWFHPTAGGYGVALFFALSGLLICSRLLQEELLRRRIDLKGFYIRRVCRIQPAALVYLAAVCVLIAMGAVSRKNNGVLSALLFTRNYIPAISTGDAWYTGHFWSLAIEEHYYFFVPALLVLVRRGRAAAFAVIFIIIAALHQYVGTPRIPNFQTDLEGGPIILGALAAVLLMRPGFRTACVRVLQPSIVLPLVLAIWIWLATHNGRFNNLIFVLTLPLLIVSTMLHPGSLAGRLLETEPFKFVGRISYSLYLWQEMFFPYVEVVQPEPHANLVTAIQHSWLRYLVVPAFATASYLWIEKPFIRLGHRLAKPATPGREDLGEIPANVPVPAVNHAS